MAHHLSTEQLNVNSMFTAAASTPSHSCAPAWLATSFAGSLPPPALHAVSLSSLLEHVACEEPMHPSSPADRARFLRHRRAHSPGTQAIRVSSASRSGIRAHRRNTSHLRARYHGKDPPLNSRPCGPFSFVAVTLSVLLAAASSILRTAAASFLHAASVSPCSDPMHHASLTPLHALALRQPPLERAYTFASPDRPASAMAIAPPPHSPTGGQGNGNLEWMLPRLKWVKKKERVSHFTPAFAVSGDEL
ncbi:hypothetical protein B0H14DRAFT_3896967 [Mycena olivaceomarginata]|nr:hypothetical protein B0H14DRAFT_3896967 [Mycena olivaceomarginata]